MSDLLTAALEYASRGWGVIPLHHHAGGGKCSCGQSECKSPAKHPRTANGQKDATTDPDTIRTWWTRWPQANIGLVLDTAGMAAADVDPRHEGDKTWERIADGRQWPGPIAATGGHEYGRHYLCLAKELPGKLGPGVDYKHHGYIVAPPSEHASGRQYRWIRPPNGHVPEAPSWLRAVGSTSIRIEQSGGFERIIDKWTDHVRRSVDGDRNNSLNRAAFVLAGLFHAGLSEVQATEALTAAAAAVGLSDKEIRATIRSGYNGGRSKPISYGHAIDIEPASVVVPGVDPETDPWGDPYTLTDAYAPRPPVEWLVEGVFAVGTLNMVYGGPGSLKSFLLADMCASIVAGHNWLPDASGVGMGCRPGAAMWCDWDNGQRRTHDRFAMVGRAHLLQPTDPMIYYSMAQPQLAANDPAHIDALYHRARRWSARVIVIDNLSLISGKADENSAEMVNVMAGLRRLAEDTSAAVIVIHHQNKTNGFARKRAEKVRGHSSILASLDVALEVQRDLEGETPSNEVYLAAGKIRDVEIKPFGALFWSEVNGGRTERAGFRALAYKDGQARKSEMLDDIVLGWAQDAGWFSKNEAVKGTGKNRDNVLVAIDRLRSAGMLKFNPEMGQNGKYCAGSNGTT